MDMGGNHNSQDGLEELEELDVTAHLPEWARERASGEWYGISAPGPSSRQGEPKAPIKLIVVVPNESEDDWAKARVLDSSGQATALVETLLEGGLAPERLSIFSATRMAVDVAYQPLVELKESQRQEEAPE
jgi:hypothetical protein